MTWSTYLIPPVPGGFPSETGHISKSGSLVEAVNFGTTNDGTGVASYDGITFTKGDGGPFDSFNQHVFFNDNIKSALFDSGGYSSTAETLSLTGLTIGQGYMVELFINDVRAAQSGRNVQVDSEATVRFGYDDTGDSEAFAVRVLRGSFTADATTTQDITIATFEANTTAAGSQLQGYQLRAVPEPSSSLLLGLGGLALIMRRKKS